MSTTKVGNDAEAELAAFFSESGLTPSERERVRKIVKLFQRDTRHKCAEAISALEGKPHIFGNGLCVRKNVAFQAVMNAE